MPEEYRALNEYAGRISLFLRGAKRETSVALLYRFSRRLPPKNFKPSKRGAEPFDGWIKNRKWQSG
jgi:hypothetical protein